MRDGRSSGGEGSGRFVWGGVKTYNMNLISEYFFNPLFCFVFLFFMVTVTSVSHVQSGNGSVKLCRDVNGN